MRRDEVKRFEIRVILYALIIELQIIITFFNLLPKL